MTDINQTTPETVDEAHYAAFTGKWNMCKCAEHCGMELKQFKYTFREYLKYNKASQDWN